MFESPAGCQFERKFLLSADRAQAFWAIASARLERRARCGPPIHVRTTYFDTADLACHRSSGGAVRRRLRVREYSNAAPTEPGGDHCYIELKQSFDGMRHKHRIAVHPLEAPARLATLAGAPVAPCVATWYRRRAFDDPEQQLRVTLDDQLYLLRPRPLGRPVCHLDPGDVLAAGPDYVLELKFFDAPPDWLSDALAGLDEAVGFSKFLLGMSALRQETTGREMALSCTG